VLSHSLKGTIGYVKVRYEGGESSKVGHSLRQRVLQCEGWNVLPWTGERGGLRKERLYVAYQLVYKSRLRVRRKSSVGSRDQNDQRRSEGQATEENGREDRDREKMGGNRGRTEDGKDVPIC